MAGANKKELFTTIQLQKEKIAKYEAKLKDVVTSYKGLASQNKALEASLAALSSRPPNSENTDDSGKTEYSTTSTDLERTDLSQASNEDSSTECDLQSKVATLTEALATLSSEKSRIELSFQSDKKRLLAEKEKLEAYISKKEEKHKEEIDVLNDKIKELRSRIIVLQHERDEDLNNNAAVIRELESKLSHERLKTEKLENNLSEAQELSRNLSNVISRKSAEQHQKQITNLQNELEQVQLRLKKAEKQCEEPPMLKKLEAEVEEMRKEHLAILYQERLKAEKAEESAREMAQVHEERVMLLETRLSELSFAVATYDRTRLIQQDTIFNLKKQLTEAMEENNVLKSGSASPSPDVPECNEDINEIISHFMKTSKKLLDINSKVPNSIDIEGLLIGCEDLHSMCKERLVQLRQEFEDYKIQRVLDIDACKCGLQNQMEEMKEKLRSVTAASQLMHEVHSSQVESLREEISLTKANSEDHLRQLEQDHRVIITGLEHQLASHRQRSLATLQERDEEIKKLTEELHKLSKTVIEPNSVVTALLSQVKAGGPEGPLLHHFEEISRRDVEITKLKKDKRELESAMREIQMASLIRQQAQQDAIEALREELERYKRNNSREGESLEYLKNVILQYMICTDIYSKQLILNAISAILKFTPAEFEQVRQYNALWWWQAPPKLKAKKTSIG